MLSILLVLCMTVGMTQMVFADTGQSGAGVQEPPEIQDYYQRKNDPVIYYKVNTNQFSQSPIDFYRDMLKSKMATVPGSYTRTRYSPQEWWIKICGAVIRSKVGSSFENSKQSGNLTDWVINYLSGDEKNFSSEMNLSDGRCKRIEFTHAANMKKAEEAMLSLFPLSGTVISHGMFAPGGAHEKEANNGPVFYKAAWGQEGDGKGAIMYAVVFSDFKVTPLLPENKNGNYVSQYSENSSLEDEKKAQKLVNDTPAEDFNGTESMHEDTSWVITSTINGSKSYSFSESLTVGAEFGFPLIGGSGKVETQLSSTQEVSEGWENAKEQGKTKGNEAAISTTIFPFTAAMMQQTKKSEKLVTKYNCPVALSYRVRILHYRVGYKKKNFNGFHDMDGTRVFADFGPDSQKDLYTRYIQEGHNKVDREDIDWTKDIFKSNSYAIPSILKGMAVVKPIASTPANFEEILDTVESRVSRLLPTRTLSIVDFASKNDDTKVLEKGDTFRVDKVPLVGLVKGDGAGITAPYFGFDSGNGHWVLLDENKDELPENNTLASLTNEDGRETFKALSENKIVYLKYCIDEDVYNTFDYPDVYATNAKLDNTALIKVSMIPQTHYHNELTRHRGIEATEETAGNITYWRCEGDGGCLKYFTDPEGKNQVDWEEIVIPKKGHTLKHHERKEATEKADGNIEYWECEGCGDLFSDAKGEKKISLEDTIIPKNTVAHVHNLVKYERMEPTETNEGNIQFWACLGCGKYFSDQLGKHEISENDIFIPKKKPSDPEEKKDDNNENGGNEGNKGTTPSNGGTVITIINNFIINNITIVYNCVYDSAVEFTGGKFKQKDVKALEDGSYDICGVKVKLDSGVAGFSTPKFKFKNVKHASVNSKKPAYFTISYKANKGATRDQKKQVKGLNKEIKGKKYEITIEQADLSKVDVAESKVVTNSKKTKVKKAIVTISGNKLTLKKKDFTATFGENNVTLTGKGDYKNSVTLPLN